MRVKKEFKTIHTRSDDDGNMFIVKQEPVYQNKRIYVHLKSEQYPRFIGEIDMRTRRLLARRKREKHLHRQMNAYGFNYILIHDTKQFSHVLLEEEFDGVITHYLIPNADIIRYGAVKYFKPGGLEVQYFLKLEQLEKYKMPERTKRSKLVASPSRQPQTEIYKDEYD